MAYALAFISPRYAAKRLAPSFAIVMAVRTPASASYDHRTHPVPASSEYTNPVSTPRNTRPPTTDGCPQTALTPGNPKAHFSLSFGTSAAFNPVLNRVLVASSPQPF